MAKRLKSNGRSPNLPLNNEPASGWKDAADWAKWGSTLPNAYVYRLRVVGKGDKPLPLSQATTTNERGLLYVGETGIKNKDPSSRVENLACGVTDQSKSSRHSAAPKYWTDGWPARLAAIDKDYRLQVGWDEQTDETIPAAKDERLDAAPGKDQMTSHSGKAAAMGLEDLMLRQFASEHPARPPLNDAPSPGWRDRDRKTRHGIASDLQDRGDGEVEMGDPDAADVKAAIAADKNKNAPTPSP